MLKLNDKVIIKMDFADKHRKQHGFFISAGIYTVCSYDPDEQLYYIVAPGVGVYVSESDIEQVRKN